ncbi:MAG: hypothetical protein ACSHXL_05885 [Bacteroidota bacterium]
MLAKKILLLSFLSVSIFFSSCKKVEGTGGSSTLKGKITALDYNNAGVFQNKTYDAMDHNVYIIYGEGKTTHDDKVETSYDGSFEFKYLEKGSYTIFTYEKCYGSDCINGTNVILKQASISKKKETVDIGTIEIKD